MYRLKIFLLSIFLLSFFYSWSQNNFTRDSTGYTVYFYPNKNKSSEGYITNDKPNKYWKTYYENGIIKSEGNRKNFQLDSLWKFYDQNGQLALQINYKEDKKNGIKTTFSKTGKIDENYVNDIKQGYSKYYYPSGNLHKIVPFVAGKEYGIAQEYSEDSIIITLFEYKKGFLVNKENINRFDEHHLKDGKWKDFYSNGNLKFEGTFSHGVKNGFFKDYSEQGSLIKIEKYIDGVLQLEVAELEKLEIKTDYYPNGNIRIEGSYKDTIPEGIRRYYSEDGKITNSKIYKTGYLIGEGIIDTKGLKQGAWKEYYLLSESNGKEQIKSQGSYKNNFRIGAWKFYYSNGNLEQQGSYTAKGKEDGAWKWYYRSGNLWKEETFENGLPQGMLTEYSDADENNRIILAQGKFIDGEEEGKWTYNIGDEKQEGSFIAGRRNGVWKHYYNDNGQLSFQGEFIDDNFNGRHKYFWSNGNTREEGNYIMGEKDGDWKTYNEDGTLFFTITYKNGLETKYNGIKIKSDDEAQPETTK